LPRKNDISDELKWSCYTFIVLTDQSFCKTSPKMIIHLFTVIFCWSKIDIHVYFSVKCKYPNEKLSSTLMKQFICLREKNAALFLNNVHTCKHYIFIQSPDVPLNLTGFPAHNTNRIFSALLSKVMPIRNCLGYYLQYPKTDGKGRVVAIEVMPLGFYWETT
jgi:hypothetical protein